MSQTSDSCLDTWTGPEALVEAMVSVIGRLYRTNSLVTTIHLPEPDQQVRENLPMARRSARRMSRDNLFPDDRAPLLNTLARLGLGAAAFKSLHHLTTPPSFCLSQAN